MVLSSAAWSELIELGVLEGEETCALCAERPLILVDVARAPILLCPAHALATLTQIQADLNDWAMRPGGA
jgi:hypothetical protein